MIFMATAPDPDPGDAQPEEEEDHVAAWRYLCLQAAGYPEDIARVVAFRFDIDLHRACDLLVQGCSVKDAERILL